MPPGRNSLVFDNQARCRARVHVPRRAGHVPRSTLTLALALTLTLALALALALTLTLALALALPLLLTPSLTLTRCPAACLPEEDVHLKWKVHRLTLTLTLILTLTLTPTPTLTLTLTLTLTGTVGAPLCWRRLRALRQGGARLPLARLAA
eukprot:scaffold82621_cov69-Phaeocystis_antarctica.AAC.1